MVCFELLSTRISRNTQITKLESPVSSGTRVAVIHVEQLNKIVTGQLQS